MRLKSIQSYVLLVAALFFGFPLYGFALIVLLGDENKNLMLAAIVPYAIVWLSLGIRTWIIRCPRCHKPFFRIGILFVSLFKCCNCRLSIFNKRDLKEYS